HASRKAKLVSRAASQKVVASAPAAMSRGNESEKQAIRRVVSLVPVWISQRFQEPLHIRLATFRRQLHSDQNTTIVVSLIAIMEQADVPVRIHRLQEAGQRTRPLGKLEPEQHLVLCQRRAAAHHIPKVSLRKLVASQVQSFQSLLAERIRQLFRFVRRADLYPDENMCLFGIRDPVVEFSDTALAQCLAEPAKAPALLRDRQCKQRLAGLADVGALGHKAQAVEVHVGAAGYCHQCLVLPLVLGGVKLCARQRQRARRLKHAARVLEDILDGSAHSVGIDSNEIIYILAYKPEGFRAHQLYRRTI